MSTEEQRIEQEAPAEGNTTSPAPPPLDDVEEVARPPEPAPEPGTAADAADAAPEPVLVENVPVADGADLRARAGKADEYLALAQRTQADFENYRKRMLRDVRAAEARGMGRLAKEMLPALDNLDRAVAALEGSEGEHHLADGIRLVTAELSAALQRTGIEGYAAKGERFDPVFHEAVAQTPVEGAEPGTIVEVLQAGYRLNDAVLRPARVVVAA
ncbi:MAG: molecular chaperone GrpE [Solirubrobacteraceae bacterium]|nr:molecular chaperone GrpE [Solirubrobacteraceae bacterium]